MLSYTYKLKLRIRNLSSRIKVEKGKISWKTLKKKGRDAAKKLSVQNISPSTFNHIDF